MIICVIVYKEMISLDSEITKKDIYTMEFQKRLKNLRKEKGLTQQELASSTNIARSSLSSYENGERIPDDINLKKLCNFFNVSTDYLLGYTVSKSSPSMQEYLNNTKFSLASISNLTGIDINTLISIKNGSLNADPSDNYLFIDDLLYNGIIDILAQADQDILAYLINILSVKKESVNKLLINTLQNLSNFIDEMESE